MRVWVTGATGFVGSTLVERLKARGDHVVALVRPCSSRPAPAGVDIAVGELPELQALARKPRPDAVFHCAAAIDCTEPQGQAVHVEGTLALAEAAGGARFVHVSTSHVFGDRNHAAPLTESTPCAPSDAYGRTKLEAERRLLSLRPDALVFRPPGIYGPGSRGDVVLNIAQKIARGRFYHIGRGEAQRSWLFVETLVDALLYAAAHPELRGVYLIDDGRPVSRRELAATIASELGHSGRFFQLPPRLAWALGFCAERSLPRIGIAPPITTRGVAFRTSAHALDTTRLRSSGFAPRFQLRDGVRATLEWAHASGRLARGARA